MDAFFKRMVLPYGRFLRPRGCDGHDAGATGSATGTLEIAKERFSLKHAFAVMEGDPLSDCEKENLVVLLSDVAVPDAMRRPPNDWRIWVSDQAGAGAIHGLIVTLSPRRKFCGQRQRRHQTGWGLMF